MTGAFNARLILMGAKLTDNGVKLTVLHSQFRGIGKGWDESKAVEAYRDYNALYMVTVYGSGDWAVCQVIVTPTYQVTTREVEGGFSALR